MVSLRERRDEESLLILFRNEKIRSTFLLKMVAPSIVMVVLLFMLHCSQTTFNIRPSPVLLEKPAQIPSPKSSLMSNKAENEFLRRSTVKILVSESPFLKVLFNQSMPAASLQTDTPNLYSEATQANNGKDWRDYNSKADRRADSYLWEFHKLGDLENFKNMDPVDGSRWIAYFSYQIIALVKQTLNGHIKKCTVIEVIKKWEVRAALDELGEVIPLIPMSFSKMLLLVSYCGENNPPKRFRSNDLQDNEDLWSFGSAAFAGILPGTMWCGMGDRAERYEELGPREDLDRCCRNHDLCPIKVKPMATRFGFLNQSFRTKSHCACDYEFYHCLKQLHGSVPQMVGHIFFDVIKADCVEHELAREATNAVVHPPIFDVQSSYIAYGHHTPIIPTLDIHKHLTQWMGGVYDEVDSRLLCPIRDENGFCRKWVVNPRAFFHKIVPKTLNITF